MHLIDEAYKDKNLELAIESELSEKIEELLSCLKEKKSSKRGPVPVTSTRHMYYGATYLLEKFSNELGLTSDLKACFPNTYKKLLSIAFYLILEDNNPLYRFEKWHLTHKHPYGEDIVSPRSSELFSSIQDEQVNKFFRLCKTIAQIHQETS